MALERITVFGSSCPSPEMPDYAAAYRVGACIARHGLELVNGGYSGTMEASAKGARDCGGAVTGVTVQIFRYAQPNPYLTRQEDTPDLLQRLARLAALGDFYVVLPGSTGTLLELCLVWEFLNKGMSRKPILAHSVWRPIAATLPEDCPRGVTMDPAGADNYQWESKLVFAEDIPEVLDRLLSGFRG